jgi:nucleotide-binding universal stress UspA family protein
MKSILIPTDFSACAEDAMHVGMTLAKKFGAKVHLYSKIDLPWNWKTMIASERDANKEAQKNIRNTELFFEDIKKRYQGLTMEKVEKANISLALIHKGWCA